MSYSYQSRKKAIKRLKKKFKTIRLEPDQMPPSTCDCGAIPSHSGNPSGCGE